MTCGRRMENACSVPGIYDEVHSRPEARGGGSGLHEWEGWRVGWGIGRAGGSLGEKVGPVQDGRGGRGWGDHNMDRKGQGLGCMSAADGGTGRESGGRQAVELCLPQATGSKGRRGQYHLTRRG